MLCVCFLSLQLVKVTILLLSIKLMDGTIFYLFFSFIYNGFVAVHVGLHVTSNGSENVLRLKNICRLPVVNTKVKNPYVER